MEEAGWIRAQMVTTENKRRARVNEITARGQKHLEAEEARWSRVTAAVGCILRYA